MSKKVCKVPGKPFPKAVPFTVIFTYNCDNTVIRCALCASAARYEGFNYECWGHSTVIDPYGDVVATCDETEQIVYADIDLNRVDEVRRRLPTFLRLRRDVYSVAE